MTMFTMSCEYNDHKGLMDSKTNQVFFYGLVFENIIHAINFLKNISPGDYKGWVKDSLYGVFDKENNRYYTNTLGWVPPPVYTMMTS